jgi:hypothetical protein
MHVTRTFASATLAGTATLLLSLGTPLLADPLAESDLLARAAIADEVEKFSLLGDIEAEALVLPDASAVRNDDKLILTFASGLTKSYQNAPECKNVEREADCEQYKLIVHSHAHRAFIILKAYYEDIEYLVTDDNSGEEVVLPAFPIFSPSGNRMLVRVINDGMVGFQVQLWKRHGDRFVSEWTGEPFFTGQYMNYDFVGWPDEDVIDLRADENRNSIEPNIVTNFQLRHTSEGWRIVRRP